MNYSKLSKKQLISLILDRDAELYKIRQERDAAIKELEEIKESKAIARLKMFGKKSEQRKNVFNEAEISLENNESSKKVGRPKESTNFDYDYLEKHIDDVIVMEPDELSSNPSLIHIGEDISFKVEWIPGRFKIIKIINKKYVSSDGKNIFQKIKDDPFPHSICTPSFASQIMEDKFLLGVPYYRQEQYYYNNELQMSRQNLCNYQMRATEILKPYYERLKYYLIHNHAKVICADETTQKIINEGKTGYIWVYLTSYYDNPIYIYEACLDRKASNPISFLKDYNGFLLTDAYQAYASIPNVTNCYCWIHARRNFMDIVKSLNDSQKKSSKAKKMVDLIDLLLHQEKLWRDQSFSPQIIFELRNRKEYKSILDDIHSSLELIDASPSSPLGKARDYMLKRWDGFTNYLKDGHVEMTNNISERAVKPFVIARKNFLFSFSKNGADSSAIYFSIQQTARANGFDPKEFTEMLLSKLKPSSSVEEIDALLPWNLKD